jgi:hypothetical protein
MYASLARFGYTLAKKLRPSKIKAALQGNPVKKGDGFDRYRAMDTLRTKSDILLGKEKSGLLKKGIKGTKSKIAQGYGKLYAGTLGTSTRRKVTSGTLTGFGAAKLGSWMDEDDSEY